MPMVGVIATGVRNNLLAIDFGYIYLRTTAFLCINKAKTSWLIFVFQTVIAITPAIRKS